MIKLRHKQHTKPYKNQQTIKYNHITNYNQYNEALAALKFASRASKIEVLAKVLRYIDYEKLYQELQLKMDAIQDTEYGHKKEVLHKQMRIEGLEGELAQLR